MPDHGSKQQIPLTLVESPAPPAGLLEFAWLLGVLDQAARALDLIGSDIDANVVRAHKVALLRGEQWPGDVPAAFLRLDVDVAELGEHR